MFYWCLSTAETYGGQESCNFRKHMQIEKAPANQENIFISLPADGENAHNTNTNTHTANAHNTNKYILFAARFFFGCVVSICSVFLYLFVLWAFVVCVFIWLCCEHLQRVRCQFDESFFLICRCFFSICSAFLFLVVLWAFAACALSNWGSCFLNLQVFFLFAARWALSATVETLIEGLNEIFIHVYFAWKIVVKRSSSCSSLPFELRRLYIELSCHIKEHHNGIIWISWKKS